jgi:hypothetical protein
MSNRNRQPRQSRQVKIFSILEPGYEEACSDARMDAIAEQQRDWAQTRSAVQALQNEYDAIFRGVTHR